MKIVEVARELRSVPRSGPRQAVRIEQRFRKKPKRTTSWVGRQVVLERSILGVKSAGEPVVNRTIAMQQGWICEDLPALS
jgi:hypothetical protein